MILLHLSDLHFDIRDPLELMYSKWDSMIECIIKNMKHQKISEKSGK